MTSPPHEVGDFLARFPPFTGLSRDALERVSSSVRMRSYRVGEDALIEDGPLAAHFFVVRSGAMELVHQGEVIDVLEPGESFGHPSLLTGLAPAFTVRAHEDALCYLIPKDIAIELLGRPAGARFVAGTLRERLVRAGHTVHAMPEVRTMRVTSLISRPPVFCAPEATIREAAQTMREQATSALLVRGSDGLAIMTEADLRDKVVAGGLSPDEPLSAVVTAPVVTLAPERLAVEAAIEMLHAGVRHLPVVDARGGVLGVVSAADLMNLESLSPFALRRSLATARDGDSLVEAASHLPRTFVALLDAGLPATEVGRVLALQSDTIVHRLVDLAFERYGPAPVPWAWLALGSVARREVTLASDQDNALAYSDSDDEDEVDAYFARVATDVNAGLARCGFGADQAEVLARNPQWRMSESEWLRIFAECFEHPDRPHLVRAALSFDFRHVAGGLEIVPPLVELVRQAPSHKGFLDRLARTATTPKPPLGFRRRLRGTLDVKRGGIVPIANIARFYALANGVTISRTLDRLSTVEELGALDADTAKALREAFAILAKVRLEHHAAQIESGRPVDNIVDSNDLPPLARLDLQEALRAIADAQRQLHHHVPLGM